MLMGPFLEQSHNDIYKGEIYYEDSKGEMQFVDYEQLFQSLMDMIAAELKGVHTKVIIVPSSKDIHHIYPIPQPKYEFVSNSKFCLMGNPQIFDMNDIKIGVFNGDVTKDLC